MPFSRENYSIYWGFWGWEGGAPGIKKKGQVPFLRIKNRARPRLFKLEVYFRVLLADKGLFRREKSFG